MLSRFRVAGIVSAALLLQGCIIKVSADGADVSRVFGSVDVDSGEVVGDVESVNGSISLDDDSQADDVETVNGSIRIRDNVSVRSVETVNGSIRAERGLTSDGSVTTVNGRIELREGSTVGGDVETVNGKIELEGVRVRGSVETVNGDMFLTDGTVIEGDVIFDDRGNWNGWGNRSEPRLFVDRGSEIKGRIILYQEVELDIEGGARVGEIVRRYRD